MRSLARGPLQRVSGQASQPTSNRSSRKARAAAQAVGLDGIGWHLFRHKYITLLRGADTPLDVQKEQARHADIRTTMGYGTVPVENKRTANDRVARAILQEKSAR